MERVYHSAWEVGRAPERRWYPAKISRTKSSSLDREEIKRKF